MWLPTESPTCQTPDARPIKPDTEIGAISTIQISAPLTSACLFFLEHTARILVNRDPIGCGHSIGQNAASNHSEQVAGGSAAEPNQQRRIVRRIE